MAFTIQDYHDLVQLLAEHPEWRSELRGLLLSDELLTLPEIVRGLAVAQKHTQEGLGKLELVLQGLVEQGRTLGGGLLELAEKQLLTRDTLGGMKGLLLETRWREKISYAHFGPFLRRVKVTDPSAIDEALEEALAPGEFRDVFGIDLLVNGQLRRSDEPLDIWLAIEISVEVDERDVDDAWRRASLIRRAGYRTLPVAAGERVTMGAESAAQEQNVVLVEGKQVNFWEEALSAWVNILK